MDQARRFRAIKGVRDILPPETALWNWFEETARRVMESYGFREIRLPIFEDYELFARSVGPESDIVTKELLISWDAPLDEWDALRENLQKHWSDLVAKGHEKDYFVEFKKRLETPEDWKQFRNYFAHFSLLDEWTKVSLRPEATASVVRAYIEHGMHTWPSPVKLYYVGPMFRRERPQKGRYRQFYQIGAEVLGQSDHPAIDAELIEMLTVLLERCWLERWTLFINSIGCKECRPAYVACLRKELEKVKGKLGPDSQRRIESNPLRVLDSKLPEEQAIIEKLPRITEHLCAACREHFAEVQDQLKLRGIPYKVNWRLVRGLDYYMRTTFEITSPVLGAQNALVGGGRYDGLSELLGGPPAKGIGFALGEDRFIEAIKDAGKVDAARPVDVFLAWIGGAAYPAAVNLARRLREESLVVEVPSDEMKLKKSLGLADKLGARYAVLLGENELASGQFILRRLADGEQKTLSEAELLEHLTAQDEG